MEAVDPKRYEMLVSQFKADPVIASFDKQIESIVILGRPVGTVIIPTPEGGMSKYTLDEESSRLVDEIMSQKEEYIKLHYSEIMNY